MTPTFEAFSPRHATALQALVRDPSLAVEFETLQADGATDGMLCDSHHVAGALHLAFVDGRAVGFSAAFVMPDGPGAFSMLRLGVVAAERRRGIGGALLARTLEALDREAPERVEDSGAAWEPNDAAAPFAARHGFAHVRWYWLMDRPRAPVPAPAWPAGITLEPFDGGTRHLADFCDALNDSFAEHYHFAVNTPDSIRSFIRSRPAFRPDGLMLAYRDGRCAGFCRGELWPERGEVALLGTTRAARGIGLGRALLRWGVEWLERAGARRHTLLVDGQNEGALALYVGEGFAVTRRRGVWARPRAGAPA
jgi:mycothiol synthase